jgi:hypothetical protein
MVSSPGMKGVVGVRRADWFEPSCHREGLCGPQPAAQIALVQSLAPPSTAAFGVVVLRVRTGQWLGLALDLAGVGLVVG